MTDRAFTCIQNTAMCELLDRRAIDHVRTRRYTPRTHDKAYRVTKAWR